MGFFDFVKEGASKSLNWGLDKVGFEGGVVGGTGWSNAFIWIFGIVLLFLFILALIKHLGGNKNFWWLLIIPLIYFIVGLFFLFSCPFSSEFVARATTEGNSFSAFWYKLGTNFYGCGQEVSPLGRINYYFLEFLGFKQTPGDFIGDFLLGLFAGLILWIAYELAFSSEKFNSWLFKKTFGMTSPGSTYKIRSSWLNFIASSPWKAPVIGLFYATLLQIPFITPFINIITFKVLGTPPWARAVIVAFYFGLLPAGYEAYRRYKLRNKYYEKVLEIKSGASSLRELTRS
jgi:hypothetical protein